MAEPPLFAPGSKPPAPGGSRVAVVGGGLAGLTAALRLAQSGFAVTVYEAKHTLGGILSANKINGVYHDVYPHMFCPWYANFWQVFGAIHNLDPDIPRAEQFDPRAGVNFQAKHATNYLERQSCTTLTSVFANLTSRAESWPHVSLL